jgi:non-canonical poly(A) RNA polymerase PAPD5/7
MQYNGDGMILALWQPTKNFSPTPWLQSLHGRGLEAPGIALHKEVIDFYEWVKPRDFEHAVRADLITRLQKALERLEPGGRLKAFGSFAAGLYLPTGDMDLVFLRSSFRGTRISSNGKLAKPKIEMVRAFANFIRTQGLAQGMVKPILHAKVPIIKFVEKVSGLKVDLSFDNDTGVTANETFHKWKVQYPAMPILVSIIKHFLMMRGLNDVAFGGLGGFSIICLVTSLVQHFPSTSQPPNLGLMLLEFFNLYGNLFNRHDVAIRLDPPSYISKV